MPAELAEQPHFRELPVAKHGFGRYGQDIGHFVGAQSAEEAQFDDLTLALVNPCKCLERLIEGHQIAGPL